MTVADSMSPGWADGVATTVTEMHYEAGETVLRFMAGTLSKGIDRDDWAQRQWQASATVQRRTDAVLGRLARDADGVVGKAVLTAYRRGYGRSGFDAAPSRSLTGRLMSLLRAVWASWRQAWRTLWGTLIARGTATPAANRAVVVQRELNRAADGLTAFRTGGRAWTAPGYVRQAVSHQAGQAVMDGWFAAIRDEGRDLVIVPEKPTNCPKCAPWVGKVLSISGGDPQHASVAEARAAGLWHPNCAHEAEQWFPGYQYKPVPFTIRRTREVLYEAAQRERAIERTLRQWRQREAAALDDVARARAARKVKQWAAELRKHRAQHGTTPRRAA